MAVQKNFVIRNGIEVNNNLLVADSSTDHVGIGTSIPKYTLEVIGGIGVTDFNALGISTVNDLKINGKITAGSSLGASGQYLISTGTGVSWSSPTSSIRTVDRQTAGVGISTFTTSYSVGLLDVFINGVKLSDDEFTATDQTTVVLDTACFGGETVEFVSYSPVSAGYVVIPPSYWTTGDVGIHTLSDVGIGTTNPTSALTVLGNTSLETLSVTDFSTFVGDVNVSGATTLGTTLDVIGQSKFRDTTAVHTPGAISIFTVGQNIDGSGEDHFGIYYDNVGAPVAGTGGQASLFTSNGDIRIDVNDQLSDIIFGDGINDFVTINGLTSNVGIGTTNPLYNLEVIGSARVGVDTSAGVILTSPNGTTYQLYVENDGTLKTIAV